MNRTSAKGWEKEVSRLVVCRIAQEARETDVSDVTISELLQARASPAGLPGSLPGHCQRWHFSYDFVPTFGKTLGGVWHP